MKRFIIFIICLIFRSGDAGCAEILELAGSTTVEKRLLEPTSNAMERATGITLHVRGLNSGKGFEELKEGRIKASISSAPMAKLLEKAGLANDGTYQEHIITTDTIVPIVHLDNPVTELTHAQLSDLHTGKMANWKSLGGADQPVVIVTSQKTAATRIMFQEVVMNKAEYAPNLREVKSTRQEIHLVSRYKGGIGAVSASFVKLYPGRVKVIKTKSISRPLSFITRGTPEPIVQRVIDFLRSDAARKFYE
ncbi:MAG: substrate-binding domain-containing protein [Magnetococcales bacterium]|nr:substrate-binding domain-containing protein [Magnetococcales bacterium]